MLQALETVISILFVFLSFSLVVSAAREVFAAWLRLRSKALKTGLDELMNNLGTGLKADFWDHPFIKMLMPSGTTPSYIPAANIAATLLHIASGNKPGTAADIPSIQDGLGTLKYKSLSTIIATAIEQSGSGAALAQVQASLEKWVDNTMERVSSMYHRSTRIWLLLFSLAFAAILNADAIAIWQRVASDKILRESLVAQAEKVAMPKDLIAEPTDPPKDAKSFEDEKQKFKLTAKEYQNRLKALTDLGLPIGWDRDRWNQLWNVRSDYLWIPKILGIIITGLAASLGAPFWFDLLQRFMNIRSAIKPPTPEKPAQK